MIINNISNGNHFHNKKNSNILLLRLKSCKIEKKHVQKLPKRLNRITFKNSSVNEWTIA